MDQILQYHNNPFIYDTWELSWQKSDIRDEECIDWLQP